MYIISITLNPIMGTPYPSLFTEPSAWMLVSMLEKTCKIQPPSSVNIISVCEVAALTPQSGMRGTIAIDTTRNCENILLL
jgi:hypothetical protein